MRECLFVSIQPAFDQHRPGQGQRGNYRGRQATRYGAGPVESGSINGPRCQGPKKAPRIESGVTNADAARKLRWQHVASR